jgi:hypothetical protein
LTLETPQNHFATSHWCASSLFAIVVHSRAGLTARQTDRRCFADVCYSTVFLSSLLGLFSTLNACSLTQQVVASPSLVHTIITMLNIKSRWQKLTRSEHHITLLPFLIFSRNPRWPCRGHLSPRCQRRNRPCPHPSGRKPFQRQAPHWKLPRGGDGAG